MGTSIPRTWSRLHEFDADRRSGRAARSNHAIAALRKCREAVPAVSVATELLAEVALVQQVAPRHLGEAAARRHVLLPPNTVDSGARRLMPRTSSGGP